MITMLFSIIAIQKMGGGDKSQRRPNSNQALILYVWEGCDSTSLLEIQGEEILKER